MLTILFDGIAYGMLLFVLACGLSVTLGLMNFVNLAHGAFAMAGRLYHARPGQPRGRAVLRRPAHRLRGHCAHRSAVRARALCARLCQEPPRAGAVHHRARVHVGRRRRLRHGLAAGLHPDPERAAGAVRDLRRWGRPLPPADHRDLRASHGGPAAHSFQHPFRQPAARLGRRCPGGTRARYQRQRGLHPHIRVRVGPRRVSAARLAPRSSASTRPFRSNSWSIS